LICEELWHPSVSWLLGQDGAEILIVQTAASIADPSSPDELSESLQRWEALALSAAITNRAFLILVNRVGSENDFHYFGRSFVVSPYGRVIARAPAFENDLLVVDVGFDHRASFRLEQGLENHVLGGSAGQTSIRRHRRSERQSFEDSGADPRRSLT